VITFGEVKVGSGKKAKGASQPEMWEGGDGLGLEIKRR